MGIILSKKEIDKITGERKFSDNPYDYEFALLRKQIKEMVEWGDEPCPHDSVTIWLATEKMERKRRHCQECWQGLRRGSAN